MVIIFLVKYKNEYGTVVFDGGAGEKIRTLTIEGLGLPTPDFKTIEFADENGVTQIGKKDMARTITVSCDITANNKERQRINRILYEPGELYCIFDDVRRKIQCKCLAPPNFQKIGGGMYSFVVQFQADYPYFTDFYKQEIKLWNLRNVVTDTFTLPCVFTERISRASAFNSGDKYVYPYLKITNQSCNLTQDISNIIIINHTTGAVITINHVLLDGEVIMIDLATRRIKSSISGDISNSITDDTVLADFYFIPGENDVEFVNATEGQLLNAVAIYDNEYLSAEV